MVITVSSIKGGVGKSSVVPSSLRLLDQRSMETVEIKRVLLPFQN